MVCSFGDAGFHGCKVQGCCRLWGFGLEGLSFRVVVGRRVLQVKNVAMCLFLCLGSGFGRGCRIEG